MKTSKTLVFFVIYLILGLRLSITLITKNSIENKLDKKNYMMNKVAEGFLTSNKLSLDQVSSASSASDAVGNNLPTVNNKGFKCIKSIPKRENFAQLCAYLSQTCVSKGAVLLGPDDNGQFLIKLKNKGESMSCDFQAFGLPNNTVAKKQMCYTTALSKRTEIKSGLQIPVNPFSHRVCVHMTFPNVFRFVKQLEQIECKPKYFSTQSTADNDCFCYTVFLPKEDNSLRTVYFPMRINDGGFQCVQSLVPGVCDSYASDKLCLGAVQGSVEYSTIQKADIRLNMAGMEHYFDRWICPSESGLRVTVKFEKLKDGKNYSVNCLTRKGKDCFYDENAEDACKRFNSCPEAAREFAVLKCGNTDFKNKWFHDGFRTPLSTWCKNANSWIRFDASVNIQSDNKRAIMVLPNGMTGCIPDPTQPEICLAENDSGILLKTVAYYKANPSNLNSLIVCNVRDFPDSNSNANHWCANSLILPDADGNFQINLDGIELINPYSQ